VHHYDRETNAHFGSDKPFSAIIRSLIVLYPGLTLNQLCGCASRA